MKSQRYAVHILADKKKVTLDVWENLCLSLRDKGVDTEDEEVFVHGYGDCYMTDLICEQAMSVLRAVSSSGVDIVSIATFNGDGEEMDWVFRAPDPPKRIAVGKILDILHDYETSVRNGERDGYPQDCLEEGNEPYLDDCGEVE